MASSGPRSPTAQANDNSIGTAAWSLPSGDDILASDNAYARVSAEFESLTSYYLTATNYGFSIPAGATIDGIVATIEKIYTGGGLEVPEVYAIDNAVKLIIGGTVTGDNKANNVSTDWGLDEAVISYGGAADTWGTTPTAEQINASTFGIALAVDLVDNYGLTAEAQVDHIALTVHYTEAASGQPCSARSSLIPGMNRITPRFAR